MRVQRLLNLAGTLVLAGHLLLPVAESVVPQNDIKSPCGCSLVNKSIPLPSYINFVKVSADRKTALLRLVNNTDCVVQVEARGGGVIALPMGRTEVLGNAARGRDGEMMSVDYYLQDIKFNKPPRIYYVRGHTISVANIQPGLSVTFSVPLSIFKRNNIMVPVKVTVGEITFRHNAYFYASDLSRRGNSD